MLARGASLSFSRSRLVFKLTFFCSSGDLLATLATKRTPVFEVRFTPRNLCLAAGPMQDPGS